MSVINDQTKIYNDFSQFNELRHLARSDKGKAIEEVAKQFEGIFLQSLLKSMRSASKSISDNSLFNSNSMEFYQQMFDQQITQNMTSGPGMGLANMIAKQLSNGVSAPAKTDPSQQLLNQVKLAELKNNAKDMLMDAADAVINNFENPIQFVKTLWHEAEQAAKEIKIDPKVLIAQAALETGWGKHVIKDKDGQTSFNLFNIKSGKSWTSDKVQVKTAEYYNGEKTYVNDYFRKYQSFKQSFDDYIGLLKNNSRYHHALTQTDNPEQYLQALQKAGYATDPKYADKILSIFNGSDFKAALKDL